MELLCSVSKCTTVLQPAAALQLAIVLFHNVCVGMCVRACLGNENNGTFFFAVVVFKGQTPFDVADESVVSLLEELSQRQANVRTHSNTQLYLNQSVILDGQKKECL